MNDIETFEKKKKITLMIISVYTFAIFLCLVFINSSDILTKIVGIAFLVIWLVFIIHYVSLSAKIKMLNDIKLHQQDSELIQEINQSPDQASWIIDEQDISEEIEEQPQEEETDESEDEGQDKNESQLESPQEESKEDQTETIEPNEENQKEADETPEVVDEEEKNETEEDTQNSKVKETALE